LISDAVDGFLARKLKITSKRGAALDSFGDVLTFTIGLAGLYVFEPAFIKEKLIFILIAVVPYFIQLGFAYIRYGRPTSFHTYMAKIAAVIQGSFLIWAFFFGVPEGLFYIVVAISVIETFEEIALMAIFKKWTTDVKGLYWVLKDRQS